MELSGIAVTAGQGGSVVAELRADASWGDRGYWITVSGWGGTEEEARAQIDAALTALDLGIDKIGEALSSGSLEIKSRKSLRIHSTTRGGCDDVRAEKPRSRQCRLGESKGHS